MNFKKRIIDSFFMQLLLFCLVLQYDVFIKTGKRRIIYIPRIKKTFIKELIGSFVPEIFHNLKNKDLKLSTNF